ncbi:MAG: hypothetical protein M1826_005418, partial [Phylliscum demangeonii]
HTTPSTTGSRGAKDRAVAKLHDMAPDIALYEKEKRRVGGVTHGGRRSSADLLVPHPHPPPTTTTTTGTKRRSASDASDSDDAGGPGRARKRAKKAKPTKPLPPVSMKLLLTSYRAWVGEPKKEDEEKRRLRELGIVVVTDASQCTHLVAPAIVRTQKFISALAYAPVVLASDFIPHCVQLPRHCAAPPHDLTPFLLRDHAAEDRLGVRLLDALARAHANQRRLLRGIAIYCTPSVHGGFETYKAIVEANGGACLPFRGRLGAVAIAALEDPVDGGDGEHGAGAGEGAGEGEGEGADDRRSRYAYAYLLTGDSREEKKVWARFRHWARQNDLAPRVVRPDWVLDAAMSQLLQWRAGYEWEEGKVKGEGKGEGAE